MTAALILLASLASAAVAAAITDWRNESRIDELQAAIAFARTFAVPGDGMTFLGLWRDGNRVALARYPDWTVFRVTWLANRERAR